MVVDVYPEAAFVLGRANMSISHENTERARKRDLRRGVRDISHAMGSGERGPEVQRSICDVIRVIPV